MLIDVFIALLVALVLTWLFATALGSTGPWSGAWVFFAVLLLFMWAIGLWVRPIGPAVWGVYWLPYIVFGAIVALLIAGTAPVRGTGQPPDRVREPVRPHVDDATAEEATVVAVSVFVWVALIILALAIAIGYVW